MPLFNTLYDFYNQYEAPLARLMFKVSQRGLLMDEKARGELGEFVITELENECTAIEKICGAKCVYTASRQKEYTKLGVSTINLGSNEQLKVLLRTLGLKVPIHRQTRKETTNEAALFTLYGETGHPVLNRLLSVAELNHMLSNFVRTELLGSVFYSDYVASGTVTGRRSSRANIFDAGGNGQNIPKHTKLGKMMRRCVVARPGRIFLSCDQRAAEDWVVWAIIADVTGDESGIRELGDPSIKRHQKLASFIFHKPYVECHKDTMLYYLAKKTRHGNNYGMRGATMSAALASERIQMDAAQCDWMLTQVNAHEPQIRRGFQYYVEKELIAKRELRTPIGRRRYFLDLRPGSDNAAVFRDGFSYIPQSTVGDNTGLAELAYEAARPGEIVGDHHDAMLTEPRCDPGEIRSAIINTTMAFNRTFTFPGGYSLYIPIEFEMGFNLRDMHTVTLDNVEEVLRLCQDSYGVTGSPVISNTSNPASNPQKIGSGGVALVQ